MGQLI